MGTRDSSAAIYAESAAESDDETVSGGAVPAATANGRRQVGRSSLWAHYFTTSDEGADQASFRRPAATAIAIVGRIL